MDGCVYVCGGNVSLILVRNDPRGNYVSIRSDIPKASHPPPLPSSSRQSTIVVLYGHVAVVISSSLITRRVNNMERLTSAGFAESRSRWLARTIAARRDDDDYVCGE